MAEILIQWGSPKAARYATEPSLRRRGDIREVGPNDHTWGRAEDYRKWLAAGKPAYFRDPLVPSTLDGFPNSYRVIQVGGISAPNMRKMLRRWTRDAVEGDPEFIPVADRPPGEEANPGTVEEHRYAWRVNIRELPAPKRIELRDTGFTTITKAQFVAAAVHKALSVEFDDTHPDGVGALRLLGSVDD